MQPYFRATERPEYYDGKIWIHFRAVRDTPSMIFHALGLDINNSTLRLESSTDGAFTPLIAFAWTYDSVTSQVNVTLPNGRLFRTNNNYSLYVEFRRIPGDDNLGFYRTSYLDNSGNRRWLITSQLEYIEARKSFPCFDEPGFKSTYKITIIHDSSLNAISNMPVASKTTL